MILKLKLINLKQALKPFKGREEQFMLRVGIRHSLWTKSTDLASMGVEYSIMYEKQTIKAKETSTSLKGKWRFNDINGIQQLKLSKLTTIQSKE